MKFNKHIVILTPGFPTDETDENCIPPLQIFLNHFIKIFPEVKISVIALHYPFRTEIYKWNSIQVYACGGNNKGKIKRLATWKRALNYSKQINQKEKIDLVHSFWLSECALLGNHLSKKFIIPHINTMMGQDAKASNRYLSFINLERLKIITLSETHNQIFFETTGRQSDYIIPWGIENENNSFEESNSRYIDIIGVGSLTKLKNYQTFVKIIAEIKNKIPSIKSVLIGDGVERENIEAFIEKFGLQNNLTLTGNLPRKEVLKKMQQSKILLHTSVYESLGYVYLEALSTGLYIVSFKTGIAKESDRWKVVQNELEMIDALINLLNGNLNYERIINYPIENTVKEYAELYGVN